jgi:hypothetical protein
MKNPLHQMKLTKDHPLFSKFDSLTCRLSPENLCCDGEISRAQVAQRLAQIRREWKDLERQCGFKVTQEEVEKIAYSSISY